MKSVRERSIFAVRIAKYGPLRKPIRILIIAIDQFSHIIRVVRVIGWAQHTFKMAVIGGERGKGRHVGMGIGGEGGKSRHVGLGRV